jgi:hypothetical protein
MLWLFRPIARLSFPGQLQTFRALTSIMLR